MVSSLPVSAGSGLSRLITSFELPGVDDLSSGAAAGRETRLNRLTPEHLSVQTGYSPISSAFQNIRFADNDCSL